MNLAEQWGHSPEQIALVMAFIDASHAALDAGVKASELEKVFTHLLLRRIVEAVSSAQSSNETQTSERP